MNFIDSLYAFISSSIKNLKEREIKKASKTFTLSIAMNPAGYEEWKWFAADFNIPAGSEILSVVLHQKHDRNADDVYHSVFSGFTFDNQKVDIRFYSVRNSSCTLKYTVDVLYRQIGGV